MATEQERQDIRQERIEGVRTLQSLGEVPRDVSPEGEEDARFGAWPAGSLKERSQQVGLATMSQADGENFLSRGLHEESISIRMERDRGTQIGDDLIGASGKAPSPSAVEEQGASLKQNSFKAFWQNREQVIETVKAHPGFKLGNQALSALVALDEDGRISQMIGDPRVKLAVLAAKELHAGVNQTGKGKIEQMLNGEKEATGVVLETAAEFLPAKVQPLVKPAVKAAQTARRFLPEKGAEGQAVPERVADLDAEVGVGGADGHPKDSPEPKMGIYEGEVFKPAGEKRHRALESEPEMGLPKGKTPEGYEEFKKTSEYERSMEPSTIGSGPRIPEAPTTFPITQSEKNQPAANSVAAQLNTRIAQGAQADRSAAERQRRITAMLNGEDAIQQQPQAQTGDRELD